MDWQPRQPDSEPDSLDRLLADAQWGEPSPQAVRRLQNQWRELSVKRIRRRRQRAMLTAAMILMAVGFTFCMHAHNIHVAQPPSAVLANSSQPSAAEISTPHETLVTAETHPVTAPTSRQPNPYEQLTLTAYRRTHAAELLCDASESPSASDEQPASPRETPIEAMHPMAALVDRGDTQSVGDFLDCVGNPKTSAAALECLANAPAPPVEALFQHLRGSDARRRMAAAQALGRLEQPTVSRQLAAMAIRGIYRQEAMTALLTSSEPTAQQFVAEAARNPYLSAALWNAQRRQHTIPPRRS